MRGHETAHYCMDVFHLTSLVQQIPSSVPHEKMANHLDLMGSDGNDRGLGLTPSNSREMI